MIPFNKFKTILGKSGSQMTDEEIKQLRDFQDKLADSLFDFWLDEIKIKDKK